MKFVLKQSSGFPCHLRIRQLICERIWGCEFGGMKSCRSRDIGFNFEGYFASLYNWQRLVEILISLLKKKFGHVYSTGVSDTARGKEDSQTLIKKNSEVHT